MLEGICSLSIIPVRSEPSGKSTMVNQLLFGDRIEILEEYQSWYRIVSLHDNYEGWCEKNQVELTGEHQKNLPVVFVSDITSTFTHGSQSISLLFSSQLPKTEGKFLIGGKKYSLSSGSTSEPMAFSGENLLKTGFRLMGSPYLWGGRSPFGIDCSGLTQIAFKMTGYSIPRDAWQQAEHPAENIDLIQETVAGDIAFFDNEEGRIIHTGILTGEGTILHASGRVRIDPVDHQGIFNQELGLYTHKLRIIKRFGG